MLEFSGEKKQQNNVVEKCADGAGLKLMADSLLVWIWFGVRECQSEQTKKCVIGSWGESSPDN
jgi:hypothetical protein